MLELDHLAVAGTTLEAARSYVEEQLGVGMSAGGAHVTMGTHNALLGLGPGRYLEAIAIDPRARAPRHARWFGLDSFAGPARLLAWILRCSDLEAALGRALPGSGQIHALERGDLAWRMAVPADGVLPLEGYAPALMQWHGSAHPAARLPESGCRLAGLTLRHPDADRLVQAWPELAQVVGLRILSDSTRGLSAEIDTPFGRRFL